MRNLYTSLVTLFVLMFLGINSSQAQRIDVRNQVEASPDQFNDVNSIVVPTKKIRKKRSKDDSELSVEDLKAVADRTSVRYRKKRNGSSKCFKDVVKRCDSKKIKELMDKVNKGK